MRLIVAIVALIPIVANCAPFITPEMVKRNGLTDEQYEHLWSIGKKPQVDIAAAREWAYRSFRYNNVTSWLHTIGRTNNYAALAAQVPKLTDENRSLASTNSFLLKSRDEWRMLAESWHTSYTNRQYRIDRIVAWAEQNRDKALLPATKALWQGFIDKLTNDEEDVENDGKAD